MLRYVCKLCGEKFQSEEELKQHILEYHHVPIISDWMIGYELDGVDGLEKVLGANVSVRGVGRNYVELVVSVSASNIPFFWKEVSRVLNKLIELDWYPEFMSGDFESYLMEWYAVVSVDLDKIKEVLGYD